MHEFKPFGFAVMFNFICVDIAKFFYIFSCCCEENIGYNK